MRVFELGHPCCHPPVVHDVLHMGLKSPLHMERGSTRGAPLKTGHWSLREAILPFWCWLSQLQALLMGACTQDPSARFATTFLL